MKVPLPKKKGPVSGAFEVAGARMDPLATFGFPLNPGSNGKTSTA